MTAETFLDARAAAARLGVSRRTLYAYVSRGLLVSEPGPGPSRARRYPRAGVDELRARRERRRDPESAARGSLHWGLPVLDSGLTLIQDGRLYYRGRDAIELSRAARLEEVAALLWTGSETDGSVRFPALRGRARVPAGGSMATAMAAHLVAAADRSLVTLGSPPPAVLAAAGRAVAGMFAAAGAAGDGPLAERLARGWGVGAAGDLEAALILAADHELNVSSFSARCVASADARLEQVLLAALCALRGRRHGGVPERVEALVADAAREGPGPAAERALADGRLPGFGHPLYPDGDPRGAELLRRVGLDPDGAGGLGPEAELIVLARDQLGQRPTLDFGLAALGRALDLPPGGAFALFALGRAVGWVAHAFEAWSDGRLIRPRARYTGPPPAAV
jgi:citrate synthase